MCRGGEGRNHREKNRCALVGGGTSLQSDQIQLHWNQVAAHVKPLSADSDDTGQAPLPHEVCLCVCVCVFVCLCINYKGNANFKKKKCVHSQSVLTRVPSQPSSGPEHVHRASWSRTARPPTSGQYAGSSCLRSGEMDRISS